MVSPTHISPNFFGLVSDLADDGIWVKLADFRFQTNERFFYEYDFGDPWQHEVRIERRLAVDEKQTYPTCVGGQRVGPPEDCGGPWAFMERRGEAPWEARELLWQIADDVKAGDLNSLRDRMELIRPLLEWLTLDQFDRRRVNRRLKQYALGDEEWMWE